VGALATGRPDDLTTVVTEATIDGGGVARAASVVDGGDWLTSIELLGPDWRGRTRSAAPAPHLTEGFGVSDPILLGERFSGEPDGILDAMLPTTLLGGARRATVYFEVYGLEPGEPVEILLTIDAQNRSFLRRITDRLNLTPGSAVDIRWTETADLPDGSSVTRHRVMRGGGTRKGHKPIGRVVCTRGAPT
jgi:hypothetical protein